VRALDSWEKDSYCGSGKHSGLGVPLGLLVDR
jgi:hypothetical protein